MNKKILLFVALSFVFTWVYCYESTNQENQIRRLEMNYSVEKQKQKFFIGLELKTNNEECSSAMPAHKERFFKENSCTELITNLEAIINEPTNIKKEKDKGT